MEDQLHKIDERTVLEIGKEYFGRIIKVGDKYSISKRIKGLHNESVIKSEIARRKIHKVFEMAEEKGAVNYNRAVFTKSVYFSLNGVNYRLSDHKRQEFEGVVLLIKWNTDLTEINKLFK